MTLPTYDSTKHDISLDGKGWMLATGGAESPTSLMRADAEPATSRAAIGDGGSENFTLSSYFFQTDVEGGVGQVRLASADRAMCAFAETRFQGHIFPPKSILTTGSVGGAATGYFREGSTLYGILSTTVEAIGSGTPISGALPPRTGQRPRTSSTGASFWATTSTTLLKKIAAGAISNITTALPTGVAPYLFDLYTRFAWVIGRRTLESTSSIKQSTAGGLTSGAVGSYTTRALASRPQVQNTLVLALYTELSSAMSEASMVSEGWTLREWYDSANGGGVTGQILVYTKQNPGADDQTIRWEWSTLSVVHAYVILEVEGVDADASFVDSAQNSQPSGTAVNARLPGTVLSDSGIHIIFTLNSDGVRTHTPPTNYTELYDNAASTFRYVANYRADTTDTTSASVTPNTTTGGTAHASIKLKSNAITADLDQTVFLYSSNDGATWEEAFNGDSSGMPLPITSLAAQGSLWITTEYGLYEFKSEDTVTVEGTTTVLNAIRGPMDEFHYPHGTQYIGTALANFDGSLYYNLGATLRRFPPGGRAEQIWPPHGYAGGGGNVISVISGEGGIYFGTDDGVLWNYDGRGFHQLAKATADQLSLLHWHQGRLYLKGDPAPYLEYGYPSLRPDVYDSTPRTYTTGYLVTSILNFEKVGDLKIARRFETHGEFTHGESEAESGYLQLEYCIIDEGFHPDSFLADDNTADWVVIGTHSVDDGNVKSYTLPTPIEFKRLLLRIKLVPGSLGIPICEGFGVDGEALMLARYRFPAMLSIATDTVDRTGAKLYPTEDLVAEAVDQIRRWRDPEHPSHDPIVTLTYRETGGATTSHTCILEKVDAWLEGHQGVDGEFSYTRANVVFREIP